MRTTLLKVSLLCMGLLLSVAVVSAQDRFSNATSAKPAAQLVALASANSPTQIPAAIVSVFYTGDDGGKGWDYHDHKDGKGDGDNDGDDHHHKDHHPTPEPSTLLSFGAAILIGGGVLYSRRLRATRK
jgi:hypothetical protein